MDSGKTLVATILDFLAFCVNTLSTYFIDDANEFTIKSCFINISLLFYKVNLLSEDILNQINEKKPKDWDYRFCDYVYDEISKNKVFITNLGKCTQIDARPLPNEVLKKYLDLLFKEIDIIKPKVIIAFGNQVSSIILNKKISVSENRKVCHKIEINNNEYKVYPVYYPVGNGIFNIDKSIEDIKWIIENEIKENN